MHRVILLVHQIHRIAIMWLYKYPIPERGTPSFVSLSAHVYSSICPLCKSPATRTCCGPLCGRSRTDSSRGDTRERAAYSSSPPRQDERRRKILLLDSRVMHKCIDRVLAFPLGSLPSLLGGWANNDIHNIRVTSNGLLTTRRLPLLSPSVSSFV